VSTGRVKVLDVSPEEAKKVADITALCAGERLRSIRNPTLLIADADDLLVPWQLSELIAEEIAHARLVKLDHGGHHFPRTQVEAYNTLLLEFFRAHAERDALRGSISSALAVI
jgi:aminoacrylate hydrolase